VNGRCRLRRVVKANLAKSPWKLTTADLAGWMATQDWAPETRKGYRITLNDFYKWAIRSKLTKRNPAADLQKIQVPRGLPRPAPEDVIGRALAQANDRDRLILLLGGFAGMRRAEIAALRFEDFTDGRLRVRGKGGKDRSIPVHPSLERELVAERERREHGRFGTGYRFTANVDGPWLFPSQSAGHLSPARVTQIAGQALGGHWRTHALRHRFATRTLAANGNLLIVQTLLGHESPNTTTRYTQLADGALAAAVNAI
jgi:integrase